MKIWGRTSRSDWATSKPTWGGGSNKFGQEGFGLNLFAHLNRTEHIVRQISIIIQLYICIDFLLMIFLFNRF